MKRSINTAFVYAIAAMAGGVFYREFTKLNDFSGRTALGFVHTHLFLLGMVFFLILALFQKQYKLEKAPRYKAFYLIYNIGLAVAVSMLVWRGVTQVLSIPLSPGLDAAISGIAGLGHVMLGVGIVLFFLILKKRIKQS
ncbi:MAG: DUF2871 domain-containing protein [Clostridiales bacterium]|nr:DUF2871 domain-containing protein [Clostridiales bacterium]